MGVSDVLLMSHPTGAVYAIAPHMDGSQGHLKLHSLPPLQLPHVQDNRKERSVVHYRAFHKLCAGCAVAHKAACRALDTARGSTADQPE